MPAWSRVPLMKKRPAGRMMRWLRAWLRNRLCVHSQQAPDNLQEPEFPFAPSVFATNCLSPRDNLPQGLGMEVGVLNLPDQVVSVSQFEEKQILRAEIVRDSAAPVAR